MTKLARERLLEALIIVAMLLVVGAIFLIRERAIGNPQEAPPTLEELRDQRMATADIIAQTFKLPAEKAAKVKDHWGNALLIEERGDLRLTRSMGPDGKLDTVDDIRIPSEVPAR